MFPRPSWSKFFCTETEFRHEMGIPSNINVANPTWIEFKGYWMYVNPSDNGWSVDVWNETDPREQMVTIANTKVQHY